MITLLAAYGARYNSQAELLKAWKDGKDFQIILEPGILGPYCSIRDVDNMRDEFGIIKAFLRSGNVTYSINL
jgi:hypothetical protein